MSDQFSITWRDAGKWPQCPPNPAYPEGKDVDVSWGAERTCKADLPHPAKRIGAYVVRCNICGYTAGCTTAGRPDAPRSVTIPCKAMAEA